MHIYFDMKKNVAHMITEKKRETTSVKLVL